MRKVKSYCNLFLHSLIPYPSYYSKILRMNFTNSFFYFLVLIIGLNIIFISSIYTKINYSKTRYILSTLITSLQQVPNDFQLQINKGYLTKSYNYPYFFWINDNLGKKLVITIDETADAEKIRSYKSLFLLTSRDLVTLSNNIVEVVPLSTLGNISINKSIIQNSSLKLQTILNALPFLYICIIIVLAIIIPLTSLIVTIIYLLIASLIGCFTYRIFTKKHVTFKKSLQIAFHAATLPLLVDYFVIIMKPTFPIRSTISIPQNLFPIVFIFLLSLFVFTGIYEAHVNHNG
jgi:hypothetical protein